MTSYEFTLVGGKTMMQEPHSTRYPKTLSTWQCLHTHLVFALYRRLYAHPGSAHCPVMLTQKYFEFLGDHQGSVVPQCSPGNRNKPHPNRSLNYTSASEDLQYTFGMAGINARDYSEHSMKRGGATEAARCGASREEIQIAGHWACPRTVEKYIDASQIRQRAFNQYFLP